MENIVCVATKKSGSGAIVGYFAEEKDVPPGWTLGKPQDISDVIASMRCTKEQALKDMNKHWQ